jgi:very-short-patch-repair endonuclease
MTNRYDWEEIQRYYDSGSVTWENLRDVYGVSFGSISKAKKRGVFNTRNKIEAQRISDKRFGRVLSEETKKKISEKRKAYLKANPDKVPYLMNHYSKGDSYPEQYFNKCLNGSCYEKKYRVGNYELDFADIERGIDLEIDGEQHFVDRRIVEHDLKRNDYLISLGWKIIRIRWSIFQKIDTISKKKIINSILDNEPFECEAISLFGYNNEIEYIKMIKDKNNHCQCGKIIFKTSKNCFTCSGLLNRKIMWPDKSYFEKVLWEIPTTKIAKNLGMSDNAVAKHIKKLGLTKPPRGYWNKNGSDSR